MIGEKAYQEYLFGKAPEAPEVARLMAEPRELSARYRQIWHDGFALQWQIANTLVSTRKGYEAKIREINRAEFADADLVMIAFQVGREAERLGIGEAPTLDTEDDRLAAADRRQKERVAKRAAKATRRKPDAGEQHAAN